MSYEIYFLATTIVATNPPAALSNVTITWPGQNSVPVTDSTGMANGFVAVEQPLQFTASRSDYKSQTLTGSSANNKENPLVFLLQGLGPCFIVSAATGSPDSVEVRRLQQVRARIGEISSLSSQLITQIRHEYYRFSPELATRLEEDGAARAAVVNVVVRPLMAWYDLAVALGLESLDKEGVERHVQAVLDACQGNPGRSLIGAIFEAIRSGKSLPADTPQAILPYMDRIREAAGLHSASWAILDPLLRVWTLETRHADLIDEMSEWLASAPLETLHPPGDPDVLDEELRKVAGVFDFRPASRRKVGRRLASAWPTAVPALIRNGFLIEENNPA